MRTLLVVTSLAAMLAGAAVARASELSSPARPTLEVRTSAFGPILFDGSNRALYAFTRDRRGGRSTCYGACAAAWPPYYAKRRAFRVVGGAKRSLLGTVRRRDGRLQITYAGRPLYYYVDDGVGAVKCQNVREFGGLWLVQRASGALVR